MARSGGSSRLPDLVYPVKDPGEELRYSLRSVAKNARGMFRKVWIVGDLPGWITGVESLSASGPTRNADVRAKITAAANHPQVAPTFVMMNDDYFLVEKIDRWQPYHQGPLKEHLATLRRRGDTSSGWLRAVEATASWMAEQGYPDGLTWQGHRPLLWDRVRLAEALDRYPANRLLDTIGLYDMAGAGCEPLRGHNSKVGIAPQAFHDRLAELSIPWLSSNDRSFAEGLIGGYIRGMFREPCRFERGSS